MGSRRSRGNRLGITTSLMNLVKSSSHSILMRGKLMPSGCCEFSMILSKNGEYFLMHIFMRAIEHKDNPFTHLVNIPGSSKMETIAKLKLNRTGKTLIFSILQKTLSFIRRFLKSSELINFYFLSSTTFCQLSKKLEEVLQVDIVIFLHNSAQVALCGFGLEIAFLIQFISLLSPKLHRFLDL